MRWMPGYSRRAFRSDVVAGLTVAAMLVPQSMAYALLAGLPPTYGLYASVAPLLIYAVLGTSYWQCWSVRSRSRWDWPEWAFSSAFCRGR
jgi:MFS superfamily sulfate permease-like transporter